MIVNETVEKYFEMTEYEFQSTLDKWIENVGSQCDFCGSKNICGENIEINDVPLYNFELIVQDLKNSNQNPSFFIYNLLKSDAVITKEVGGKRNNEHNFILACWPKIIEAINKIPTNRFINNDFDGQFYISITGNKRDLKIHRLKNSGLEKSELIRFINEYFEEYDIFGEVH
jgi:hypothetical protein